MAIFWIGADGNAYLKGNGGNGAAVTKYTGVNGVSGNGFSGINSGGGGQDVQAYRVNDPNAPQQSSGNTGGNTVINSGGGGGGGGSSAASAAAAQQAEAARVASAEKSYNNTLSSDRAGFTQAIGTSAGDYGTAIGDAFNGNNGYTTRQANINNEGIQNDLSKIQGMQDIRDMVNNGIQGAGVMLDNYGAGSSSAGDAIARAYGVQARQQASKVGSQYAQGQNQVQTEQSSLSNEENNFMTHDMPQKKADMITAIVQNAQSQLANLNYMATIANIPDRVDILQEMNNVKAQATSAMSALDGQLTSAYNSNAPTSADDNQAKAMQLHTAGSAPTHQFDYTTDMPTQFQNTGPVASPLPIFTGASNKDNTVPATA